MSYELRHDEKLGDGLRRICRKQIENALAIAMGKKETDDTPVHQTRKHLKKARAALRLVRKEIGHGIFERQDCCLRDAGHLISDIRDAEVRLQTVRQLQGITQRSGRGVYRELEKMLMLELENFLMAFAEWQAQAIPILEDAKAATDCWEVDHFSCKQMRRAIQATYKSGCSALAEARKTPTAANFHQFRIEAKTLWYQLRILRPINPVVLNSLADDLNALGDSLGRAHDLHFLEERLRNETGKSPWQREGHTLVAMIEVSAVDLQRGAAELGERFFSERPRDFGARVAAWLEDWTNGKSSSIAEALVS
jgi:CHAD domain-containing protein